MGDPIQPARQVSTVEVRQLSTHDQEPVLRHVLDLGLRYTQTTHPSHRLPKVGVIDFVEDQLYGNLGKAMAIRSGGSAASFTRGSGPPLHSLSMSPEATKLLVPAT